MLKLRRPPQINSIFKINNALNNQEASSNTNITENYQKGFPPNFPNPPTNQPNILVKHDQPLNPTLTEHLSSFINNLKSLINQLISLLITVKEKIILKHGR